MVGLVSVPGDGWRFRGARYRGCATECVRNEIVRANRCDGAGCPHRSDGNAHEGGIDGPQVGIVEGRPPAGQLFEQHVRSREQLEERVRPSPPAISSARLLLARVVPRLLNGDA